MNKMTNKTVNTRLLRKAALLCLVGALAFALAACGKSATDAPVNSVISGGTSGTASGVTSDGAQAEGTEYFGKIASIAGNEIEFDLAKLPGADAPAPEQPKEGDEMQAMTMVPAVEAGTATGDGAANRIEVDYTGETKSFTIPAGVTIVDPMGVEKQLTELKKGALLSLYADDDGNVTQVVYLG